MRTHLTATLGKITKKIPRTMSPKTTLANLKKKGKEKLKERGERKEKKSKRQN